VLIRHYIRKQGKNERDQQRKLFDELHEPLTQRPFFKRFLIGPALPALMIGLSGLDQGMGLPALI
jgi:hypothetical protein